MRLLQDFISALYFSKRRVSAFIIAPPSSGKSFYLQTILKNQNSVLFATKITEAGFRTALEEKIGLHTVVFSDAITNIHQRQEYAIWNIMLEATEEGVSDIVLSSQFVELKRRIAFIIALTPEDYATLMRKLERRLSIEALKSRFIMFKYFISKSLKRKMIEGLVQVPTLNYPKRVVFHSDELYKACISLTAKSYDKEYINRIVANTYYVALAFYEITGDIEAAKRFSAILLAMRYRSFDITDVEDYVYHGHQANLWRETILNAIGGGVL